MFLNVQTGLIVADPSLGKDSTVVDVIVLKVPIKDPNELSLFLIATLTFTKPGRGYSRCLKCTFTSLCERLSLEAQ